MLLDLLIVGVVGAVVYVKIWKPTREKQFQLQVEMTAAWKGICSHIRARQNAAARMLEIAFALKPGEPFVKALSAVLDDQTVRLDDVQQVASREDTFLGVLAAAESMETAFPALKTDARWQGARQEVAESSQKIAVLRNQYNGAAMVFNNLAERFPANIICALCKTEQVALFEAPPLKPEDLNG